MALRKGHGDGAGAPRVEVLPPDELPVGMPERADADSRAAAEEAGRFAEGNRRSVLGGRAKRGKSRLSARLGLLSLADDNAFAPYRRAAVSFRRAQCAALAASVGAGYCGPGPSSVVASAALALAWSRYLSDQAAVANDSELALRSSRLGEAARQHLLAAHELCAREAKSRAARQPTQPLLAPPEDPPDDESEEDDEP